MDEEKIFLIIVLSITALFIMISIYFIVAPMTWSWHDDTAIILGKDSGVNTVTSCVSDGRTVTPVVIDEPYYKFITDKGNVTVSSEEYDRYNINNTINVSICDNNEEVRLVN